MDERNYALAGAVGAARADTLRDIVAETGTTPGVAGDAGADVFGVDIGL